METMVLDTAKSTYLVNAARLVQTQEVADLAAAKSTEWDIEKSNPMIQWIAGDFAEADKPNSNTQYWTAADLELAEYTVRHAPLNMGHKFRQPIGFFASTRAVKLKREDTAGKKKAEGNLTIQALSGLWTHIFGFEAAQAEAANEAGLLFYSMECRGSHVTCGTNEAAGLEGCGKTFEYLDVSTHCEHLLERSSVRHIVNPVFRGGALIVPPMRPGWNKAHASVLTDTVMQEAAAFAEANQRQYEVLNADGSELSVAAWEQLMGLAVAAARSDAAGSHA